MKRVILILFLLQIFSTKVYAGDTDEYFAYNDKAKLFTAIIKSVNIIGDIGTAGWVETWQGRIEILIKNGLIGIFTIN